MDFNNYRDNRNPDQEIKNIINNSCKIVPQSDYVQY